MTIDRRKLINLYEQIKEVDPKHDDEIKHLIRSQRLQLEINLRKSCEIVGVDAYEVTERAAMKEDSGTPRFMAAHEALCETAEEHGLLHGHIAAALNQDCWMDILSLAYDQWKELA